MNKIKIAENNIVIWLIGAVLSFSASVLAFYHIVFKHYTEFNIIFTIITVFAVFYCFYIKTIKDMLKYIKDNATTCICIFLMALIFIVKLYSLKSKYFEEFLIFDFKSMGWCVFSTLSLSWIGIWIYRKLVEFLKNVYKELDKTDKKMYLYISIVTAVIVIVAYSFNESWYTQFDKVYSMDSGYVFSKIFQDASYYNIRHPLLSVFTFPIYAIIDFFSIIFVPENIQTVFLAVCLQLINIQLLLFSGMLLKILTKSKTIFILYIVSFPTILYFLSFEKYAICILPLILYVYILNKNHKKSTASLIISGGFMTTSFACVIMELFTKNTIKNKLKKIFKIVCFGILTIICLGRIHMLTEGLTEIINIKETYASGSYTISERFISLTKMFHGALISLSSNKGGKYIWTSIDKNFTALSIFIIILVIVGIWTNRKEAFVKFCAIWILFSILLFVGLKWSPDESPLLSIYFSWAIIPMLKKGIDYLFVENLNISKKLIYGILIPLIFLINVLTIIDIGIFLKSL